MVSSSARTSLSLSLIALATLAAACGSSPDDAPLDGGGSSGGGAGQAGYAGKAGTGNASGKAGGGGVASGAGGSAGVAGKAGASGTSGSAGKAGSGGTAGSGGGGKGGSGGTSGAAGTGGTGGSSGAGGKGGGVGGNAGKGTAGSAGAAGQGQAGQGGQSGGAGAGGGCGGGLPAMTSLPTTLSATGLYSNIVAGVVAPGIEEFRPAYELWSDAAVKTRFVYLPPCTTVDTSDMDHWSLPVGTRLWKQFVVGGARIETRLLHRFGPGPDDFLFGAYLWDDALSEATLVPDGVIDAKGTGHDVPNTNACWTCHGNLPERTLGFGGIQLSHAGPGVTLASLSAGGRLTSPPAGPLSPPGDGAARAALGYLHANCGSCHNAWGVDIMRLRLSVTDATVESTDTYTTGVGVPLNKVLPGITYRIAPGDADASAVVYRMGQRGSLDQMPPIGTEVVDDAGLQAVRDWIGTLPPVGQGGAGGAGGSGGSGGSAGGAGGGSGASGTGGAAGGSGGACSGVPKMKLTQVASGFNLPLYVTSPPGDPTRLFVVEKGGVVKIIENGVVRSTPFLDISAGSPNPRVYVPSANSEGGLLGLAFHPGYAQNGRFYLHYTSIPNGRVTVAEFRRSASDPDVADTTALPVKKLVDEAHGGWNHVGGMLAFGADGHLYAGIGDSAVTPYGQSPAKDLSSALGKILRVDVDTGAGPPGNMTGAGVYPLIWDYGLRNPWRFSFDRDTGAMYIGDVGQSAWEEIDVEPAGSGKRNYGWPYMEGTHCVSSANPSCTPTGTPPVVEHGHASGEGGSVTGGFVYRGKAIPCLVGRYVYGDFGTQRYWAMRWDGGAVTEHTEITAELAAPAQSPDSFGEDANGELYVVMISGQVHRIDPE